MITHYTKLNMGSNGKRQLAAIMFTDMVGFTSLMQQDENQAKKIRDRHRKVLQQYIQEHEGTILQYFGDGTLSIFHSAIRAVDCAIKIQHELQKAPNIPLRIGIHSGDIVYDEEGVYGDGVNIASRIESLSVPGGVLISERIYDDIKNHQAFKTALLGKYELKNVLRPMDVFAIANEGLSVPPMNEVQGKAKALHKSIAVLPFVNFSNDTENEYFSDGITEELLNVLSKVDGLQVTSRTSSFAFKGKNTDIREIAHQLNVGYVLEGSVRKAGNQVRVTAQLINADDGYHLWSENFDRKLEDIFELQDEIANKITIQLREKLSLQVQSEVQVKRPTQNITAYNLYLKGLFHWKKWTPAHIKTAITIFEEAIAIEKNFALPYSAIANCYAYLGATGQINFIEANIKAKEYAQKALTLDDSIADPYISLAMEEIFYNLDWKSAKKCLQKAHELNPGSAEIHYSCGIFHNFLREFSKAKEELDKALALDPLSPLINHFYADLLLNMQDYDAAIRQCDKVLELDPNFRGALELKGWGYYMSGNTEKAIATLKKYHQLVGHPLKGLTSLGFIYAATGKREEALNILEKMKKRVELEPDVPHSADLLIIHFGLENWEEVDYYVERIFKERSGLMFMITSPELEKVRDRPKFRELMQEYELTEVM